MVENRNQYLPDAFAILKDELKSRGLDKILKECKNEKIKKIDNSSGEKIISFIILIVIVVAVSFFDLGIIGGGIVGAIIGGFLYLIYLIINKISLK